jgi:hypothetical protein
MLFKTITDCSSSFKQETCLLSSLQNTVLSEGVGLPLY